MVAVVKLREERAYTYPVLEGGYMPLSLYECQLLQLRLIAKKFFLFELADKIRRAICDDGVYTLLDGPNSTEVHLSRLPV